ncbi:MAG: cupin domain-containing protein [Pseudomonadota bacterium]
MAKIDVKNAPFRTGTGYPAPHDAPCRERETSPLGLLGGLRQFGVNLVRLKTGVWTGQRHWHTKEDEFVWVLEGEVVLVTDAGREVCCAGDCAAFPAGDANGHHFINEAEADALLLTVGTRDMEDECHYPDIDLHAFPGRYKNLAVFRHKDGTPYD